MTAPAPAVRSVVILGAGSMGTGIGGVLNRNGVRVMTPLAGRSPASRQRAAAAGMVDADLAALGAADLMLSIVPPDQAMAVARAMLPVLADAARKPLYIECNAIAPQMARSIGEMVASTGAAFLDGCIIGLPPRPGGPDPIIYVSGEAVEAAAGLADAGLHLALMPAMPPGAASALKLSYAGITKGLVALGASMALAAEDADVAAYFRAELARSQPQLSALMAGAVPDMLGKAARWAPEMEAISTLTPEQIHGPIGRFFERVAGDAAIRQRLDHFYRR